MKKYLAEAAAPWGTDLPRSHIYIYICVCVCVALLEPNRSTVVKKAFLKVMTFLRVISSVWWENPWMFLGSSQFPRFSNTWVRLWFPSPPPCWVASPLLFWACFWCSFCHSRPSSRKQAGVGLPVAPVATIRTPRVVASRWQLGLAHSWWQAIS